ncbi:ABC transporter substrate-binding protein [Nonomuraea sediminis]|uniref:ABC transporter substrate-binding protein n=1 Tax=Nonomuraea sediminis TaxID=2835864 RepID=UPI001BDC852B|nr:extracellular solute-binding protein [Nonomuraea sediminis]
MYVPRGTRLRTTAAVAVAAALALSACTVGGGNVTKASGSGSAVTLTFLTFENPNLTSEYWDAAIARASAKVPGVTIKKLVGTNSTAYLQQLYASGQAPDIMTSISPDGFAQKGELVAWSADEMKNFIDPHAGAIKGQTYALSFNVQPIPLVYYNKNDFAKAGITAAPKTYAEFLDDCAKLKAAGITPLEIGGGGKDTWAAAFGVGAIVSSDMLTKTPDWFSKRAAGTVKFTDPDFVAAAQKAADLSKKGYIDTAGLSRSYADVEQAFRDKKAAMYPMGSWFSASLDKTKPSFDVGVFGWPSDAGQNVVPVVTGGGLMVNSKAKDVGLAKKWALAFAEDKTNLDNSVLADGLIIGIKGYTPPTNVGAMYTQTLDIYQKAQQSGQTVPAWMNTAGDGSLPPGFSDQLNAAIVDLITGRKSPQAFAAYLDQRYAAATR